MIIVQVTFEVKPNQAAAFRAATVELVRQTRREAGCQRAEFYQVSDDTCMFMIFEMYASEAALAEHLESAYFRQWKQVTNGMFSGPGYGDQYLPIELPQDLLSAD